MDLFAARHAVQARYEAGIDSLKRRSIVYGPRCRSDEGHMMKRPDFGEYAIAIPERR